MRRGASLHRSAIVAALAGLAVGVVVACGSDGSSHPAALPDDMGAGGSTAVVPDAGGDAASLDDAEAGLVDSNGPTYQKTTCGMCFLQRCAAYWQACMSDPPCKGYYTCHLGCPTYGAPTPAPGCGGIMCLDTMKTQALKDMESCESHVLASLSECATYCSTP